MRLDAEQSQLEDLEQSAGTGADDGDRSATWVVAAGSHAGRPQARPALASVGVWKYSLSAAS